MMGPEPRPEWVHRAKTKGYNFVVYTETEFVCGFDNEADAIDACARNPGYLYRRV